MSALTRPRGPLPARVYWMRRGILLVIAFLLVFTLGKVLGGGSDGKSDEGARAAAASGEQAGAPTGTPSATPSARATSRPKAKKSRVALAQPDGPCDPEDIVIEPLVERVANDGDIDYAVAVRGAEPACTWTFSNETVALKITSGDDLIWTSQECRTLPEQDLVVRSTVAAKVQLSWHGRRSDEECSRSTAWALPGSYHVVVAAMGGEPTDVQFELTRPATVKVTITPKPRQKPSTSPSESTSARRPTAKPSGAVEPDSPRG